MIRIALLLSLIAAPAAAEVTGVFQTEPDAKGNVGHIRFASCGDKLCGTVVGSFDRDGKPRLDMAMGQAIVAGLTAQEGGAYAGGRILNPESGKSYAAKVEPQGRDLRVAGCVGPFCKWMVWRRVAD